MDVNCEKTIALALGEFSSMSNSSSRRASIFVDDSNLDRSMRLRMLWALARGVADSLLDLSERRPERSRQSGLSQTAHRVAACACIPSLARSMAQARQYSALQHVAWHGSSSTESRHRPQFVVVVAVVAVVAPVWGVAPPVRALSTLVAPFPLAVLENITR